MIGELILGLCVGIFVFVCAVITYNSWNDRRKSSDFLLDTVIAFKVGLIEQKAKEKGIKLIYPQQKDGFIDEIEKEVADSLDRVP